MIRYYGIQELKELHVWSTDNQNVTVIHCVKFLQTLKTLKRRQSNDCAMDMVPPSLVNKSSSYMRDAHK